MGAPRVPDRPSEQMYAAMATCPVKCIMYYCSRCQSIGSITKRLVKLELESARANESRPASERLLDERQLALDGLRRERDELARDKADLLRELQTLKSSITWSSREHTTERATDPLSPVTPCESARENVIVETMPTRRADTDRTEIGEGEDSDSDEARPKIGHPHPPGFRELRERVGKFSGKKGDNDFCLWLKKLPKTVNGQMNCEHGGSHGLW